MVRRRSIITAIAAATAGLTMTHTNGPAGPSLADAILAGMENQIQQRAQRERNRRTQTDERVYLVWYILDSLKKLTANNHEKEFSFFILGDGPVHVLALYASQEEMRNALTVPRPNRNMLAMRFHGLSISLFDSNDSSNIINDTRSLPDVVQGVENWALRVVEVSPELRTEVRGIFRFLREGQPAPAYPSSP